METSALSFAMIIVSTALVGCIVLQSKGAGLGGLTGGGADMSGGTFSARRGLEKTLFRVTIILSFLFFGLAIYTVLATG
ncbi:MAG: preprotein translocase subunit SecG [Anaerolineales bacterium]